MCDFSQHVIKKNTSHLQFGMHTLNQLSPHQSATILQVKAGQDLLRRMAALGIRPGRRVEVIRLAPMGGPLQIRIGHTDLMIRREDAARIDIDMESLS